MAGGYNFDRVMHWTRSVWRNLLRFRLSFFQINIGGNHWVLGYIDNDRRVFGFYDSFSDGDSRSLLNNIEIWMHDEVSRKYGDRMTQDCEFSS